VEYGSIRSCNITCDKKTSISLGFAFVEFWHKESAAKGLEMNGQRISNKVLQVAYARRPNTEMQGANLYVKNVPRDYIILDIKKLFEPYGEMMHAKLLFDTNGRSRGVEFVRFAYSHQAEEARRSLHQLILRPQALPLVVEKSEPKTPRLTQDNFNHREITATTTTRTQKVQIFFECF